MSVTIKGTDTSAAAPSFTGSDSDSGLYFPAANQVAIATAGTLAVFVDASQNVGINTGTPKVRLSGQVLSINGTNSPSGYQAGIELLNNGASAGEIWCNTTEMVIGSYAGGPISFRVTNTTQAAITSAGLFQMNSGYGSVATVYGCRAWVNFRGTGTVAIRASGNVSSVTDNGTGDYRVNLTNAMPDINGSVTLGQAQSQSLAPTDNIIMAAMLTTTQITVVTLDPNDSTYEDTEVCCVTVHR